MTDIDKLLSEAEYGLKGNFVENKITDEAAEFWAAVKNRVINDGVKLKPYTLCRILEENYNIKISETAMTNYLKKLS
tara:strand:+ start:404 stop:634 length:231 start_codon:yes stop_codon:yes gene_type:complete